MREPYRQREIERFVRHGFTPDEATARVDAGHVIPEGQALPIPSGLREALRATGDRWQLCSEIAGHSGFSLVDCSPDEGHGMLIEELLDPSTLGYVAKVRAKEGEIP